jgi:phosphoglycerol transferase MdoB-like AlkP superfamily enzyme
MLFQKNEFRALPQLLSENGYTTISACGAPDTFWKMNENHAHFGFQRSWFDDSYHITERIGPWMADREFFSQTVERLKEQALPFMLFMLSSSNHHPYPLPEKHRMIKTGELSGTIAGDYLQTVHYFDSAFGVLLDGLRESGLLDQTVIALYGDHQGFLGEPPQLARALGFAEESEYHFFQLRKRLAFLIRLPRGETAEVISTSGGHLDIAPTLLSLLGIERNQSVMLGRDLTEGGDSLVVFRDGSFADNRHFFINRFGPASQCSCYEIGSGRKIDCGELRDKQQQALERLAVSDQILRGNLIPQLIRERDDRSKRK